MNADWNELQKQIERFRSFQNRTGTNKSSSYSVSINFTGYDNTVYVEFGGYDIGDWSRHESLETTWYNLVEDFTKKVDEADEATKYDAWCRSCQEYTEHDENGKCLGYWDWNEERKCEGKDNE